MKKEIKNGTLYLGDCLDILKTLPDNSVSAVVCDPPYGLGKEPNPIDVMKGWIEKDYHEIKGKGFMGKEWDAFVPQPIIWKECLRVLKPGGYLLAFAGTRTQDWMAMSLRFAGFEIRDMIAWVYGSGFPKSHNISKAMEGVIGKQGKGFKSAGDDGRKAEFKQDLSKRSDYGYVWKPTSENAKQWEGFGTALKPAIEPITMARKPLEKGLNVAQNCLKWGVGGINIDGSRVEVADSEKAHFEKEWDRDQSMSAELGGVAMNTRLKAISLRDNVPTGRFPANLILEDCEEVRECFPETKSVKGKPRQVKNVGSFGGGNTNGDNEYSDNGNASRYFKSIIYQSKASKSERNKGMSEGQKNIHPTCKPLGIMEYLINMVSIEGQVVLDPFLGSGTTAIACENLNRKWIGIEKNQDYFNIGCERINSL